MSQDILGSVVRALVSIPTGLLGMVKDFIHKITGNDRELWIAQGKLFLQHKPCWGATVQPSPKPPKKKTDTINWRKVYKALGMKFVPGNLTITADPNFWDVYVMKGVTPNMVVAILRKLGVDVNTHIDNFNNVLSTDDRTPIAGSYRVRFKKTVEADPELANKSAEYLKSENISGITLLERLLLELGYFLATGEHLDVENVTLCSGSRRSDGYVPGVDWRAGRRGLYVSWYDPQFRFSDLRARAVVS